MNNVSEIDRQTEDSCRAVFSRALAEVEMNLQIRGSGVSVVAALKDALSLLDKARADACDLAGRPFASLVGPLRRERDELLALLVPLTCRFQADVWGAMAVEIAPLHAAVKRASACTCPTLGSDAVAAREGWDGPDDTDVERAPPTPRNTGGAT